MKRKDGRLFGLVKPAIDAHTLGISTAKELLMACGYSVITAIESVEIALNDYPYEIKRKKVIDWIVKSGVTDLGVSYRLDPYDARNLVGYLLSDIRRLRLLKEQGGPLNSIFFAGLPKACEMVSEESKGLVNTFAGGETPVETLLSLGIDKDSIPRDISEGSKYDERLLEFGKTIIDHGEYMRFEPIDRSRYPEYGTRKDTVLKRLDVVSNNSELPLMRAHVGPYDSSISRRESVEEFFSWSRQLANAGFLDILSIGSSQLTQSNFGEEWGERANGGGVPINSTQEYYELWNASRPLLLRTYSGTKDIPYLAKVHEESLNISWHALSLWWFNKLDGRGPYDLFTNLHQHCDAIRYIAKTGKPMEANVSHHFAFRGADDVSYIVSAYLAAKLAKIYGIRIFVLQNMLNTPRATWGIQDLAKSRALLRLVNKLQDGNFRILFQPRAGLDYFKPNLYDAKIQLAAVSALMDDIDPMNLRSPQIIHVVSYSEALQLATPDIVNESIQITLASIKKYREYRSLDKIENMAGHLEVRQREQVLYDNANKVIQAIENTIPNTYSPEGFYDIFSAGFLPVPYLWNEKEKYKNAINWKTRMVKGSVKLVDDNNSELSIEAFTSRAILNYEMNKGPDGLITQRLVPELDEGEF